MTGTPLGGTNTPIAPVPQMQGDAVKTWSSSLVFWLKQLVERLHSIEARLARLEKE